ncbi:embryonic polyadenylate-binding protein 2 [Denticeps clupeoides]|uniref:embryonic polyadenylate-binding protein 2 n=1 Tax=Denticeps clupeoides TaxID=299321 RepID=UPI0010A2D7A3|nr:embryonic polyadenylate-binding protein 2 [Denticeps clupeoides]
MAEHLDAEILATQGATDPELEAIKVRVLELEDEDEKLREVLYKPEDITLDSPLAALYYRVTHEERIEVDNRSVYVGNVDYGTTAAELAFHFNGCGTVNRVTILCDKFTGHPKG